MPAPNRNRSQDESQSSLAACLTHRELSRTRHTLGTNRIGDAFGAKRQPKSKPTWVDVKAKLAGFDRAALLSLVQSLYAAHRKIRRSFMLALVWARTRWSRTRKPWIGASGRTCSDGRTPLYPRPSRRCPT